MSGSVAHFSINSSNTTKGFVYLISYCKVWFVLVLNPTHLSDSGQCLVCPKKSSLHWTCFPANSCITITCISLPQAHCISPISPDCISLVWCLSYNSCLPADVTSLATTVSPQPPPPGGSKEPVANVITNLYVFRCHYDIDTINAYDDGGDDCHGVSFVSTIKALCVLWQAVSYLEHTLFNEPATDALDCEWQDSKLDTPPPGIQNHHHFLPINQHFDRKQMFNWIESDHT